MGAERKEIKITTPLMEAIVTMAEGNVGALTVLARLAKEEDGATPLDIFHLDDMNMRGSQIWVAYKDWAKEDLRKFVRAARHRDPDMIETVNNIGRRGNHEWLAAKHWQHDGLRRRIV